MSAEYMHIGIPVTNKKPGMSYVESLKLWMSNPDDYEYKIEYLKFEEGTPFPEIMHRAPHVAYKVDDIEIHLKTLIKRYFRQPRSVPERVSHLRLRMEQSWNFMKKQNKGQVDGSFVLFAPYLALS